MIIIIIIIMRENEFNKLMLQIITNVIEEKHEKHFVYSRIYKKLIISKKQVNTNLNLQNIYLNKIIKRILQNLFKCKINATQNLSSQKT